MLGFVHRHIDVWHDILLKQHPLRDTPLLYVPDGVDRHDLLLRKYRDPSNAFRRTPARMTSTDFPGRCSLTVSRQCFLNFVADEVGTLVDRGCVVKCAQRLRLIMALSVEVALNKVGAFCF